ncbi:hypothetical protein KIP69_03925 [Geobacter sulfurreducens]|uniref:hypothetical protein n=1 Tax=Geobacter sulfurreducens TaxID=35554 RepID=UPI001BDBB6B2|nr:hypothetical protein [Geobacter sulfurreducens]QVW36012.1 hypothetical protein KIP69_03925 [Geobacter sulfurreducens]
MTRLSLSIQENAESFLVEALAKAISAEREPSSWKFAIFSLVQAIELSLKERLRREHPLLVYADVDNPKLSVSLDKALSRLARIDDVKLSTDDVRNIQVATSIRNSIAHHAVDVSIDQLRVVFAGLLGFLVQFCRRQLNIEVSTSISSDLWAEAIAIENYASELCRRAELQIAEEGIEEKNLLTCIKCWHDTYVDKPGIWRCFLCGFAEPTTVCQECGVGLFQSESHPAYYGKWKVYGKKKAEDWYPELCDNCYEDFLRNGPKPLREADSETDN